MDLKGGGVDKEEGGSRRRGKEEVGGGSPSATERAGSKGFCCEGVMRQIDGRCHQPLV